MMDLNGIEVYVYLFCNAISIFIISLFMGIFFDREKLTHKKCIRPVSYILYWGVSSVAYLFIQVTSGVMMIITFVGTTIISLTYNGAWKYRVCAVVTIIAVQIVCEGMIWNLLVKLHAIHLFAVGLIAVQILSFMIAIILRKMIDLRKGEDVLFGDWVSVVVIPLWSIIISVIVLDKCENEIAVAICGTSMILINILVFYILSRMQNAYRKQLDLGLLERQNKAYEYQMMIFKTNEERITTLNHDIKNHFLVLDQLVEKGNDSEVRAYLKELNVSANVDKQWVFTGNHMVDGFINIKLDEAEKYGTEITTDISVSQDLRLNAKDVSIILGNLLDNALQALSHVDDKRKKRLSIQMREDSGYLYIRIVNSHNEKLRRKGKGFQTTKRNKYGHGIGLKNVGQIVEAYGGHMEIEHTDEMFSVEMLLFI